MAKQSDNLANEFKVNLFISYAHDERDYLDHVKKFIYTDAFPGLVVWDDKAIPPGGIWDHEIKKQLIIADIVILLISQSFLKSLYINDVEVKIALQRAALNSCTIIPVFVRACPLDKDIAKLITVFQGYPLNNSKNRRFFSDMEEDIHSHLTELYNGVINAANEVQKRLKAEKDKSEQNSSWRRVKEIEEERKNNKIFLATSSSVQGQAMRKRLYNSYLTKKEYGEFPFEIIVHDELSDISFNELIDQSVYSIHVIANEDDLKHSIAKNQLDYAVKNSMITGTSFKCILWLESDNIKESLEEQFIAISRQSGSSGADIDNLFSMIKDFESDRKNVLNVEIEKNLSIVARVLMIYDFEKDHRSPSRAQAKKDIEARKVCSVRLNTPDEPITELKQNLGNCQGVILFYGDSDITWYLHRQSLLFDANWLKAKAIYISKPEIDDKIKYDVTENEFILFRGDSDYSKELDLFISRLIA